MADVYSSTDLQDVVHPMDISADGWKVKTNKIKFRFLASILALEWVDSFNFNGRLAFLDWFAGCPNLSTLMAGWYSSTDL